MGLPWKWTEIILSFLTLDPSTAFQTLLSTVMTTPFLLRDSCPQKLYNGHLSYIHPFQSILVHWCLECRPSCMPFPVSHPSHVQLFTTPWTVAHQAPLCPWIQWCAANLNIYVWIHWPQGAIYSLSISPTFPDKLTKIWNS